MRIIQCRLYKIRAKLCYVSKKENEKEKRCHYKKKLRNAAPLRLSLTRTLVKPLLPSNCFILVERFVRQVQSRGKRLVTLLSLTGWILRNNVVSLLPPLLCSLTMQVSVSISWIHQVTKTSQKILIVLWWRWMRLSWWWTLPKVSRLRPKSSLRLLSTAIFPFSPLSTSWTVMAESHLIYCRSWKKSWELPAIQWTGQSEWENPLRDSMTFTINVWSSTVVKSVLQVWTRVTGSLDLTHSMPKFWKISSSWRKLEMNFQSRPFWTVTWHLFSSAQPWQTLVFRPSLIPSWNLLQSHMVTRQRQGTLLTHSTKTFQVLFSKFKPTWTRVTATVLPLSVWFQVNLNAVWRLTCLVQARELSCPTWRSSWPSPVRM